MFKIGSLIYTSDVYNLQIKIVSFPDQEKFLKQVVVRLALFMNGSTKKPQMKHCPCPKYLMIRDRTCTIYRPEKNS